MPPTRPCHQAMPGGLSPAVQAPARARRPSIRGRSLPPGHGPRPDQQRPRGSAPHSSVLASAAGRRCASASLGVIVGTVDGDTYLAGLQRPERLGAGRVPSTRRAPCRGQYLAVPTSLRCSDPRPELGGRPPHHVASAAMETASASPHATSTHARGPGARVARRWSSRMRTDAQVQGGRAEVGRTTERRGEGALEGVREDGEGEENAKIGPQS